MRHVGNLGVVVALVCGATFATGFATGGTANAVATDAPVVEIQSPVALRSGSLIHARVVVHHASLVRAAQFTLAFDRSSLQFDGAQAPAHVTGLNTVEHIEGLTTGFFSTRTQASTPSATDLVTEVVLAPRTSGHFEVSLRDVVLTDAAGNRLAANVHNRIVVAVGAGSTRHAAPRAHRSPTHDVVAADDSRDAGSAQADWTVATENGSCVASSCATVADIQRAAAQPRAFGASSLSGPSSYTFVVDTNSDAADAVVGDGICAIPGGGCSLRAAIQEADTRVVPSTINFNIPGAGIHALAPATRYPILSNIVAPITIDGFTQPGASVNTDPLASNAQYTIEIQGMGPGAIDAFLITGSNVTIRGLDIHGFGRHIWMLGANAFNNTVEGSLIGLLPDGTADPLITLAIGKSCIVMQGGANHNHVGVPGDANRNVVSGCAHQNIATYDDATDYNVIQNNIIGLDPTGTLRRGAKSHGVDINTWSSHTLIGGTGPGERNVSSGNTGNGVEVSHGVGTQFNQVVGNYIGTTLDGNSIAPYTRNGQVGVRIEGNPFCPTTCDPDISYQSVIGNVIANSGEAGIFTDKGSNHTTIQGNTIGLTANGGDGRNNIVGIRIEAGSFGDVVSNNIISNNDNGLQIVPTGASPPNANSSPTNFNTISQNSIYNNGVGGVTALGIDLAPLGQVNTAGNADPAVNESMLAPTLSSPKAAAVDASTCANCTVELFISDRAAGLFGSGRTFLTSGVADGSGFVRLFVPAIAQGQSVTATATNLNGSSSEFSRNVAIPVPRPSNVAPIASFTSSCSHLSCTLNGTASHDTDGSIVRYQWNFGDGATTEGATASHSYTSGGSFVVTLTVTDDDAATGAMADSVNAVDLPPVASFTAGCSFQLCNFDASASTDPDGPIASYAWTFGDGTAGTGVTTPHTYGASGAFTVTLTVDDGNGATNATSQLFNITALPTGTLAVDTFSRTSTNTWGSADLGGVYGVSPAPTDYSVGGGVGKINGNAATSARFAFLNSTNVRDSDSVVDIATNKAPAGGTWGQVAGQTARRQNASLEYRLRLRFPVGGGVKISIAKVVNSSTEVQIGNEVNVPGATYTPGQMFTTRLRVTGVNPTTLQAKAWTTGTSEPLAWAVSTTDSQAELQVAGTSGLRTYLGGSASNVPVLWSFDNYRMQVVNTAPTASFTVSCTNSLCSFDGSSSNDPDGTIASYAWNFGDGTSGTGVTTTHDYGSAFGPYMPVLTVTDNFNATGTLSTPLNVSNISPHAQINVNCVDLNCTLTSTGSIDPDGTITQYSWDFGDGYSASGASVAHTFATPDVYTIALTVTDDDGAIDGTTQTVTVLAPNQLPAASFTQNCVLLDCSFDATASSDADGTIANYLWNFGDGTTGTGPTPSHSFAYTSNYNVSLTVTDDRLGTGTTSHSVAVVGPNVAPTANAAVNCTLMTCAYSSTGSVDPDGTIVSYAWNFGDGTSASTASASHTYAIAGTWPVTLTVTDNSSAVGTKVAFAVVSPAVAPSTIAQDSFGRTVANGWGSADLGGPWTLTGSAANFTVNGSAGTQKVTAIGGSTAAYLNGPVGSDLDVRTKIATDKAATGQGQWINITVRKVSTNNEYRVRVRMGSTGVFLAAAKLAGSSSSSLVGAEISAGLSYVPGQYYQVRAEAIGSNPTTIRAKVWVDGTSEPSAWMLIRTDATAGVQGSGSIGFSTFDSATPAPVVFSFANLVVGPANAAPIASFAVNCVGHACTNDASASSDDVAIASYVWNFGDGITSSGVTASHTYSAAGVYSVTLTVTDNQGVSSVATHSATVNLAPTANISVSCNGLTCAVNGSASSDPDGTIASYAWNFGDGATATGVTANHTYATSGNETVTLLVTDNLGASASTTALITPNAPPIALFSVSCASYACSADASTSFDPDGTIASYAWDFGDGTTATGVTANHTYAGSGTHTVTLTVTDNLTATASIQHNALTDLAPTASFTLNCTLLACSMNATASTDSDGAIVGYAWDFGDGATATGVTTSHTYATSGTYTVTLTVIDDLGVSTAASHSVTPNAPPVAAFVPSCVLLACTVDAATSSDPDGTIASYAWQFSDGATASGVTASHTFAIAGTWPITLTVLDNSGAAASKTILVTVAPTVAPTIYAQDGFGRTTANGWGTADLGGAWTASGTATNFAVNGGVGKMLMPVTATSDAVRLNGVTNTDFDVQARLSYDKTQVGTGSWVNIVGRYIGTNQEYRARIRFGGATVLAAAYKLAGSAAVIVGSEINTGLASAPNTWYRVRMNVTGTNPTTIKIKVWADNVGEPAAWTVTVTDASASLQVPGVAGLSSYSGGSSSYPMTFSVDDFALRPANLPPVASFVPTCAGGLQCSVDASASTDDGSVASYDWAWGDGATSTGVNSAHTFAAPGNYTVTLTVTDNQGVKTVFAQGVIVT